MIQFWRLLHVLTAFWLVTGLAGRDVTLGRARRSRSIEALRELLEVSGKFEKLMVIPASMLLLIAGLITAYVEKLEFSNGANRWLVVSFFLYIGVMLMVPTIFVPRGKKFEASYVEAQAAGAITPELTARFNDPVVAMARRAEMTLVVIVIALMVTKPF